MTDKARLLHAVMQVVGPHLEGVSENQIEGYLSEYFEAYQITANRLPSSLYEYVYVDGTCSVWLRPIKLF